MICARVLLELFSAAKALNGIKEKTRTSTSSTDKIRLNWEFILCISFLFFVGNGERIGIRFRALKKSAKASSIQNGAMVINANQVGDKNKLAKLT